MHFPLPLVSSASSVHALPVYTISLSLTARDSIGHNDRLSVLFTSSDD